MMTFMISVGESDPYARTGDVLIFAHGGKAHRHNIYMVRQNRLHPRERIHLLEIEKAYNKYMKEDHIHSTLISLAALAAAAIAALSFSLFSSYAHTTLTLCSLKIMPLL